MHIRAIIDYGYSDRSIELFYQFTIFIMMRTVYDAYNPK